MLKLVALGTLAYVGVKYLRSTDRFRDEPAMRPSDLRLAGGPLSDHASIQHADEALTAAAPGSPSASSG
jgi:hypothetical protein